MKPLVENAASKNQVKKAKKVEKLKEDQDREDLLFILDSRSGRRFLYKLLGDCGFFSSSFTGSSETFFKEGMRNVALRIFGDISEISPDSIALMMKEHKIERENYG